MFTNIFPIELEFEKFTISRVAYTEDTLKDLREQFNSTHSFFKNGKYIYISNKSGEDLNIGSSFEFDVYQHSDITLSLMRHIFFKTFLERFKDKVPIDFHPFRILSTREADDWMYELLPTNLRDKLSYTKLVELQITEIHPNDVKQFVLVAATERRWTFTINCYELLILGFDSVGCEVVHSEILPGLKGIIAPNEEFIGKIKEISDKSALIETEHGEVTLQLDELFLRKTTRNIKNFLSRVLGEADAEKILEAIHSKKRETLNHKNQWEEIKRVVSTFVYTIPKVADEKINYQNKDGFVFNIGGEPIHFDNSFELKVPTFVFDKAGSKVNNTAPDLGLSRYGPYDSAVFDIKSPRILCLCHKANRGRFTTFLQNLFKGLSDSQYFTKGLKGKYELHNIESEVIDISAYSLDEYMKALGQIENMKPNLVIVEFDDSIKANDPMLYYRVKAKMLTREIPMQVVLKSKVDKFDQYILNSIALQLYAKLGGVPWVLKSSMSVDREIVIGIGHSIIRKSLYAEADQDRVVGLTTFFSSDGQYLLSNKVKDVPFDSYFEELLKSLKESFELLKNANNWKEGDTIRLIFHIFKPIKNTEFDVVTNLIKNYPQFKIQFAFVTVGKEHPYLLFDLQGGKSSWKNGKEIKIGAFVPYRGANYRLGKHVCLVQMLGVKEVKSAFHGSSNPLLIRIRIPTGEEQYKQIDSLLFVDLQYIVQQIFSFTYLSWRNFLPSEHPATMLYSEEIAKQLGRLRKVEGWSPDVLNYNLKTKKWFL